MEPRKITSLDLRLAISVTICVLTATIFNEWNLKFHYGEMHLEIIQKMTAAISCLLCCQDNMKVSKKAGVNRMIITAIGGVIAILAAGIDMMIGNPYIGVLLAFIGILFTLLLCKCARVPYINARIGGVTFILVFFTLGGSARIYYGIFRLISTLYGVLVTLLVTWIFQRFGKEKE